VFDEQRIFAAADFLQNAVSINVQLMEEEKVSFYCIYSFYSMATCIRRNLYKLFPWFDVKGK